MGGKRLGLARVEALLENLKREINFGAGTSFTFDGSGKGVGRTTRDQGRYYLEEWFLQRPGLNAVIATSEDAANTIIHNVANKNFEVLGTNMTTALCTFDAGDATVGRAGITLTTAGADADQAILLPHLDTNQTAWNEVIWGTENSVEWECSISTNAIDNQKVWAGLKLTNDQLAITDANSVWFCYNTDATNGQTLSTTDNTAMAVDGTGMGWHVVYSIADVFYTTNLNLAVEANTTYHLKISVDSDRKASVYVNGTQYGLVNDTGHVGGNAGTDNAAWGSTNTLVNGSSGGSTSATELTLVVDGVDARTTFKAGDFVHVADTAVPIGKVKSVSALAIVLESLDATVANNVDLFNYGQTVPNTTAGAAQKSKALTDEIELIPYIGIEAGAAAAEALDVHYIAMSRLINE
tara:strand:- start:523 stop:1749 length:1227 start_codon:yes stop_codon:yes gene_type:complete